MDKITPRRLTLVMTGVVTLLFLRRLESYETTLTP